MRTKYATVAVLLAILLALGFLVQAASQQTRMVQDRSQTREANPEDINEWRGKTVMFIGAHPDDEVSCLGTFAKLIKNGNTVYMLHLTSGNKGSRDLEMTSERLAAIRRQEDIDANAVIGVPAENIFWGGYDDGMLEYVPEKELVELVCWYIRKYRPDALFMFDSGDDFVQWHKTDHRMAAKVALDGARAAAYHLYFPHHRIYEGLQPFTVVDFFFRGSLEPNLKVDITDVAELKFQAACKHTSQWGKGNAKYTGPEMDPEDVARQRERRLRKGPDGKIYEQFRRVQESMSF
jgi:LmbE family N-acetylglucosaminyl deacetylase